MPENPTFDVSSADLNRRFGEIRRRVLEAPVGITYHGRRALIIASLAHYEELVQAPSAETASVWKRKLQIVLDHVREGYLSIDADFRVQTANRMAELFIGRTRDEIVGKPILEAVPTIRDQMPTLRSVLETGEIARYEGNSATHPDRRVAVTMIPLPSPMGGVGILFDNVTEQARMQASLSEKEAALKTLLDFCGDRVIFSVDSRERIDQWGRGAEALLGWEAAEVKGGPASLVFGASDPLPVAGERHAFELRHRDGRTLSFVGPAKPLSQQSAARIYILERDG
ncbi:PAS domain-containing protein [Sphingomonas sp. ASV193]|uniref:PAS domain-containing protein n=1 Tax=Sphingomonas sp. ASV193 TaxID=3144405 RepID=UPI0032E8FD75